MIRFGRHTAPAEEPAWNDLWAVSPEPVGPTSEPAEGRELFVRHARKDGKMGAMLSSGDVHICVPHTVTARIQEVHLLTLHCLCDGIDAVLFGAKQ